MARGSWRERFTIGRVYPEGLRALIEVVEASWPAMRGRRDGPEGTFMALMERNLDDWEKRRDARGHMVGMGMGSIYDTGGPGRNAPKAEVEQFDRYWEALRWVHGVTWICAERWLGRGMRWSRRKDRALLAELEGQGTLARISAVRCGRCGWAATMRDELDRAARILEVPWRLRRLVVRGGVSLARAMVVAPAAEMTAVRARNRAKVARRVAARGAAVRTGEWPKRCGKCRGEVGAVALEV